MSDAFGRMKILPSDWFRMTYAEHLMSWYGHEEEMYMAFSMHRRTAYEVYISRPKAKGYVNKTIYQFMPLPTDSRQQQQRPLKVVREIHQAFLDKLNKEKSNDK